MNTKEYQNILNELSGFIKGLWHNSNLSRDAQLKNGYEIVTETDVKFEQAIISQLSKVAPEISILSEEINPNNKIDGTFFTIDPIDGTSNFSYGLPIYGTQVALIEEGEPVVGLIYLPSFDYMFTAAKNLGAYLNNKVIQVSSGNGKRPMFGISDLRLAAPNLNLVTRLAWIITKSGARPRMVGCTCFDMTMVACGSFQGKISVEPKLWDIAPGLILIKEAGGVIKNTKEVCIGACSPKILDGLSYCYSWAKKKKNAPIHDIWKEN